MPIIADTAKNAPIIAIQEREAAHFLLSDP